MDNRSAILHNALDLFAARGYDAVGVQEIAAAAGVTKPTLYHYFGSKQGLLEELVESNHTRLNIAVQDAASYQGDLTYTLETLAGAFFDFARENPVYYRLQLVLYFSPRESEAYTVVAGWNQKLYQVVEILFMAAARDHGNMRGRHRLYAATFIGLLNTCIGLWLNGHVELGGELIHRAVHQFQHGIYS